MAEIIEIPKPPRMRGIKQAIEELHTVDPGTAFTETALRRLIRRGGIPSVKVGAKYLVNFDLLLSYLAGEYTAETQQLTASDGICKIAE